MPNTEQLYLIKLTKAATGGVLQKNLFSNISKYLQENTCSSLFHKGADLQANNFNKKDTNTSVFLLRNFCEMPFFEEHLRTAAPELT